MEVMEVFLYNSTVCRLCGEENDNGTFLYSTEDNNQNISDLVNTYLPLRVCDDAQLPRTICPGCTIQLEATVDFINLIINGQKVIRALHQREIEYKKTVLKEQENVTENFVTEVSVENGAYPEEHPATLATAGLDKPRRKRGRPPKKQKTPEELEEEAAARQRELQFAQQQKQEDELSGKRRRRTPTRFKEVVQGKELEKIFIEEGMTDGEESEPEVRPDLDPMTPDPEPKVPEVIGHTDSGELVVVVKGKGRGRPKGRINQKRQKCAICDKEFSCSGRYMSHVAQHGPVLYQCTPCLNTFATRLDFTNHQKETGHQGKNVLPDEKKEEHLSSEDMQQTVPAQATSGPAASLPVLNLEPTSETPAVDGSCAAEDNPTEGKENVEASPNGDEDKPVDVEVVETETGGSEGRVKLMCPHCDKLFSTKQSRSMHIKALHKGERPYSCSVCGATFAYPRALALHSLKHRRKGYACDLCGKVLSHPSSVTYHKEAEHFNQKYVCNKCGKNFKHKQLLRRHQLVHSQLRPYQCKVCNAMFKTKANLMNHQQLHAGVKRFGCDICKQRFAHKTSLTLHMRWHTGQKPYVCKVCGKAFSQKGNLSEHSRIHTGEKPFQCLHCARRFTTSSQHKLHLKRQCNMDADSPKLSRSRGGVPPSPPAPVPPPSPPTPHTVSAGVYKCGWCGRHCTTRWALAKHARRHTGERPFKCPHCPRAFADCSNLNKHKKYVHKQMSLLESAPGPKARPAPLRVVRGEPPARTELVVTSNHAGVDERVIYVTYDVDDPDSPDYRLVDADQAALLGGAGGGGLYSDTMRTHKLDSTHEHMAVTDEQGNPLQFTMQDGTQLAITSLDGHTLQVVTEDGQTIPVEINEYSSDVPLSPSPPPTVVGVDKLEDEPAASITHYFTIV